MHPLRGSRYQGQGNEQRSSLNPNKWGENEPDFLPGWPNRRQAIPRVKHNRQGVAGWQLSDNWQAPNNFQHARSLGGNCSGLLEISLDDNAIVGNHWYLLGYFNLSCSAVAASRSSGCRVLISMPRD